MGMSTDVNLPRAHKAAFPDRCVVCGMAEPFSSVTMITGSIGWWTWLLWTYGSPVVVKAPACNWCGWRLHLLRLLGLLVTVAITLAVLFWIWPHFSGFVPRSLRKWAQMGLVLSCLLPYLIYQVFFPRPFDITAHSDSIDYEFNSLPMALEFALRNNDAEWVTVDGARLFSSRDDPEDESEPYSSPAM